MTHILRTITEHKTASRADEGNSESSGTHSIKHINLCKLTLRGHLNTDVRARAHANDALTAGLLYQIIVRKERSSMNK